MWYFTADGKSKVGPISSANLQELAAKGIVQREHMVLRLGTEKWAPAFKIRGLFPEGTVIEGSVIVRPRSNQCQLAPPANDAPVPAQPEVKADVLEEIQEPEKIDHAARCGIAPDPRRLVQPGASQADDQGGVTMGLITDAGGSTSKFITIGIPCLAAGLAAGCLFGSVATAVMYTASLGARVPSLASGSSGQSAPIPQQNTPTGNTQWPMARSEFERMLLGQRESVMLEKLGKSEVWQGGVISPKGWRYDQKTRNPITGKADKYVWVWLEDQTIVNITYQAD
jgi:hypothetical protein